MTATLALVVALGGTSYAAFSLPAGSVGGQQLKKNAVTSSKVKNGSLVRKDFKAGQIPQGKRGLRGPAGPTTGAAGGALTGSYPSPQIAATTRGVALAGLTSDGSAATPKVWFNRFGGEPTINHFGTGSYLVTIPGLSPDVTTNVIATTNGPNQDLVSVTSQPGLSGQPGHLLVVVRDFVGTLDDDYFSLILYAASPTG